MSSILPKITKKQFFILSLIYQFRFLDRIQIQILMSHKNHRRIHAWLNDLVAKRAIGRIYSNKMPDNTKPAVYYLSTFGRKLLQKAQEEKDEQKRRTGVDTSEWKITFTQKGLRSSYRDSGKTPLFRLQCLALVDCYTSVKQYMKQKGYGWAYYSRFECSEYDFLEELLPDSFVSVTTKNGRKKEYVLYFVTHRLPRRMIRFKLHHMGNFFAEDNWHEDPPPKIYIICSNIPIRNYSKKIIESKLEYHNFPDDVFCNLTTLPEFITSGFDEKIWKQPKQEEDYY